MSAAAKLTSAQQGALQALVDAEHQDLPVRIVTGRASDPLTGPDTATVRHQQAAPLVNLGLARRSTPDGLFLLVTPAGRAAAAELGLSEREG